MRFLTKAWNWIRGKGYAEEEQQRAPLPETEIITTYEKKPEEEKTTADKTHETITGQETTEEKKEEIKIDAGKTTNDTEETIREYEQAQKRAAQHQKTIEIEKKISANYSTEEEYTPTGQNLNALGEYYRNLLKKNNISIYKPNGELDEDLIQVLINNRQKLKHRFGATIEIHTTGGVGRIHLYGALMEDAELIMEEYHVGEEIGSQTFHEKKEAFIQKIKNQRGIYGWSSDGNPVGKITEIKIRGRFG